ncbi:hypothetical protein JCGZ_12998 [Jatropha curcas]|uniref:Uncharacterized protein n=1 Tax=Jatropha curcas TaxID=180498 RepID=A0A067KA19_JATCU|nr:uncharacterized protein LOC105638746 [Jatropha curcas]KDP32967.1 hypothetical protein JCGZ_12998 [Jatropha curcas]
MEAESNPTSHQSLFNTLDPMSLILSHNSYQSDQLVTLKLTTDSYIMERGPRYGAYAELRESKLKMKNLRQEEIEESDFKQTPPKKQVKFQANLTNSKKGFSKSSVLAQSVPDFSATLRKENRKPPLELTPPSKNWAKVNGILSNSRGSKSASAGEKKTGIMARKSYASVEELKGLSMAAASAISGENRGGRVGRGIGKTVLGYRQF